MRIIDHLTTEPAFKKFQGYLSKVPDRQFVLRKYPELASDQKILDTPILRVWYVMLRKTGSEHRMACMLVLRKCPQIMTDSVFFEGQGDLLKQFQGNEKHLNQVVALARKRGYNPNRNDIYNPSLARFPGDPEAFVPPTGGRGYIKKLCEKRGWACEGAVSVEARQSDPGPDKDLADDLAIEGAMEMAKANPELRRMKKVDLIAEARRKHGRQKNSLLA